MMFKAEYWYLISHHGIAELRCFACYGHAVKKIRIRSSCFKDSTASARFAVIEGQDTGVEGRELCRDVHATAHLRTTLGLQDRDGRVDEANTNSEYDTTGDKMRRFKFGCLKDSTDQTDAYSNPKALVTAQFLAKKCYGHCTKNAANLAGSQ